VLRSLRDDQKRILSILNWDIKLSIDF
jgi:hypothetical protein